MRTLQNLATLILAGVLPIGGLAASAGAQTPGNGPPAFRGVEHTALNSGAGASAALPDHPLKPSIERAQASLARAKAVRDYAYTFVKREVVNGKLTEHEAMFMKVRHEPFSVYVYTLGPAQAKGQEAIFVSGRSDNKVVVHLTGLKKIVGTLSLAPDAPEIMENNRYPITSAGVVNMLEKVIRRQTGELTETGVDVQVIPGAKVDGRMCTCVQVAHPAPKPTIAFQTTRLFYDDETGLPIRWEAYAFPQQAGQPPQLVEEYTYRNVQLNVGLTEADFDANNPQYGYN